MTAHPHEHPHDHAAAGDAAEHISHARQRARNMLSAEAHLGDVDDWRRVFVSARDALVLVWLTWVALHAFGDPAFAPEMLMVLSVSLAMLLGISTARSTRLQVNHFASELDRERTEIREHFDHEREEVVALYSAKGFREPLLGQVVDTLCSDEDRLLKVMMEEELGLQVHHMPHPLVVGLWNFGAAAAAGLSLALPLMWISSGTAHLWMPIGGAALMSIIAVIAAKATRRPAIEFFTTGVVTAAVTGGVTYFLSQWVAGLYSGPPAL